MPDLERPGSEVLVRQFCVAGRGGETCSARLVKSWRDPFGAPRHVPRYYVRIGPPASGIDAPPVSDIDALAGHVRDLDEDQLFVVSEPDHHRIAEALVDRLEAQGYCHQENWPILPQRPPDGDVRARRLCRAGKMAPDESAFTQSYREELEKLTPSAELDRLVVAMQGRLEKIAREVLLGSAFDKAAHVERIMTVGSSSRRAYIEFPVDFDLAVLTSRPHADYDQESLRSLCEEVSKRISQESSFADYCHAVSRRRGLEAAAVATLEIDDFGVRGKESFVARFIVELAVAGAPERFGFLDLTFGRLPQLIGYGIWLRNFLRKIGAAQSSRLLAEIRLAKAFFKSLSGVYGTAQRGLPAHAIEQMVIQGFDYRCGGDRVGTLDNLFCLIHEETRLPASKASERRGTFKHFKTRFPAWHPGWWEPAVGFSSDGPGVDLLDFLGGGDPSLAEEKWRRITALANIYVSYRNDRRPWTLQELTERALTPSR